uniref:N-acetylmuramoyl-L-alanine amidase n=1 Tax=candidate division WOR-3 bacterium TaxID=2052148 RepID=A0A7C3UPQ9_UNCW3
MIRIFRLLFFPLLIFSQEISIGNERLNKLNLGDLEYVSLGKVIKALNGSLWRAGNRVVCVVPDSGETAEKEMVFTLDSSWALVGGEMVRLTSPVIEQEGSILFPVLSLKEVFPQIKEEIKEVISVTSSVKRDTAFYFFEISPPGNFYLRQLSSLSYEVIISARFLLSDLPAKGIVREIKIDRGDDETRFIFYFKKPGQAKGTKREEGILFKFFPTQPRERNLLIVLDPGHGGKDPGAVGKLGTREKDLNLAIAKKLAQRLERAGYRVLLTREKDEFVSLKERVDFANKNKADIFISIHNNASRENPRAVGFETYFLAEGRTDLERAQALKENEVLKLEENSNPFLNDELSLILSDLAQTEFLKESEELACAIQDAADAYLGLANRGVKQAGFYVLRGALMPAVLVEGGFLTNRREEKLLRQEKTQEKIAEAIFRGVKNFLLSYEKKIAGER